MSVDLIIPVYLNQRVVFDLLAMREGGISRITKVVSAEENSKSSERRYGAEFGLSKALSSLLSISASGETEKGERVGNSIAKGEDRVHTPASLFYRLRSQLIEDKSLIIINEGSSVEVHQLVEFYADMRRSPIIETMDSLASLLEIAVLFDNSKTQGKRRGKSDTEQVLEQMKSFSEKLRAGDTVDVVAEGVGSGSKALITLETEYLNDPTMADLVDGSFRVIGKVIRKVEEGEAISLLRKSALSMMPEKILDQMCGALDGLSQTEGFNVPAITQEIDGPAFQILPIAIFA